MVAADNRKKIETRDEQLAAKYRHHLYDAVHQVRDLKEDLESGKVDRRKLRPLVERTAKLRNALAALLPESAALGHYDDAIREIEAALAKTDIDHELRKMAVIGALDVLRDSGSQKLPGRTRNSDFYRLAAIIYRRATGEPASPNGFNKAAAKVFKEHPEFINERWWCEGD